MIKSFENPVELLLCKRVAPDFKEMLQIIRLNEPLLRQTEVVECFLRGAPLASEFLKDLAHDGLCIRKKMLLRLRRIFLVAELLQLHNKFRVSHRVVAKVEAFSLMDGFAEPVGEVVAVKHPLVVMMPRLALHSLLH